MNEFARSGNVTH